MTSALRFRLLTEAYPAVDGGSCASPRRRARVLSVFSFAPMLLIAAAVGSLYLGDAGIQGRLIEEMSGILGRQGAEALGGMMRGAACPPAPVSSAPSWDSPG